MYIYVVTHSCFHDLHNKLSHNVIKLLQWYKHPEEAEHIKIEQGDGKHPNKTDKQKGDETHPKKNQHSLVSDTKKPHWIIKGHTRTLPIRKGI